MKEINQTCNQIYDQVDDQVWGQVHVQVEGQVGGQVYQPIATRIQPNGNGPFTLSVRAKS